MVWLFLAKLALVNGMLRFEEVKIVGLLVSSIYSLHLQCFSCCVSAFRFRKEAAGPARASQAHFDDYHLRALG